MTTSATRPESRASDLRRCLLPVALATLVAVLSSACGSGAPSFDPNPTPMASAQPRSTPEAASSPPSASNGPPTATCVGPRERTPPPVVSATVGRGQVVATTRGSYTTTTCSTAGVVDTDPATPTEKLLARPGDTITFTVADGWRFARWEGFDTSLVGEGANVWVATDLPDTPRSVEVPVPMRPNDSIVGLTVVLVSDDRRTIIELALELLVSRGAT